MGRLEGVGTHSIITPRYVIKPTLIIKLRKVRSQFTWHPRNNWRTLAMAAVKAVAY